MERAAPLVKRNEYGAECPDRLALDAGVRSELERAAEFLLRADREIALVARAAPVPPAALEPPKRRRRAENRPETFDLRATRSLLERVARSTEPFGWLGRLHAERARELELEARIVEHFGTPELVRLAPERFPVPHGAVARACEAFADQALAARFPEPERRH
ncbi:MAG TPA: hypothetical protein VGK73_23995, partial [Polyangiaceae bacterium]